MARHISNSLLSIHSFPITLDSKQSHSSIWKSKNVFLSSSWWKREWFCISSFSSWWCHLTAPVSAKQARSKPKEVLQTGQFVKQPWGHTIHSLVMQTPCFVQVQPGPVLFFKQRKSPKRTAGKYIFQASNKSGGPPWFEALWLKELFLYSSKHFQYKGKILLLLTPCGHSLHSGNTFYPACYNGREIYSNFTEVVAYL